MENIINMEEEMISELFLEFEDSLEKAVNHLKNEYQSLKAGRANPHVLDKILVNYYGVPTPLNQISNISVQDARVLAISLWDASLIKETIKSLNASDLGITPSDDGKIIRLVFPALTEERRREMVKDIKKMGEDVKVITRNARRDILDELKKLKKDGNISEDDLSSYEKDVQKTLDATVAKIDKAMEEKEKELMQV